MKGLWIFLGLILLLAVFWIYRKYQAFQRLYITVGGVQNLEYKNGFILFDILLNINNPRADQLTINSADLDTFIDGNLAGKAILSKDAVILANAISTVAVRLNVPLNEFLNLIYSEISTYKRKSKFVIRLYGTVGAYGINAPVDFSYDYILPKFLTGLF